MKLTLSQKPRLLLLSDMYGDIHPNWASPYETLLAEHFDLQCYDSCLLAGVEQALVDAELLHEQFLDGGIDRAVSWLLAAEDDPFYALGLSVGGTILWKAALAGAPITQLTTISSTRLRFETQKPNCNCDLWFGEKDIYRPDKQWFANLGLQEHVITEAGHDSYLAIEVAQTVCSKLIEILP